MVNPDPKFQQKIRYKRVTYDDLSFICEPHEADGIIMESDEPSVYTITDVWMTPNEFEQLPEFQGF